MSNMDEETFIAHLDALAESYGYDVEDLPTVDEILSGIRVIDADVEVGPTYTLVMGCCSEIKDGYDKVGRPNIRTDEQVIRLFQAIEKIDPEFTILALKVLMAIHKVEIDQVAKSHEVWKRIMIEFDSIIRNNC